MAYRPYIKNANGTSKNIYANNDMPTVFITSSTLTNLKRKEDGSANCEFEIRFKNQIIRCFGTGKIQGNSSAVYPAKNYTFKFYSNIRISLTYRNSVNIWNTGLRKSFIISGTSENRNSNNKTIGTINFDTTLGKPIWYKGDDMTNPDNPVEIWVDATGTQV